MDVISLDTNIHQNEGILKLSVTKHMKSHTKTIHSYTLLAGNALINSQMKFLPLQWKTLPIKPWKCNGHKDSSFDSFADIFMTYIETTTLSKTVLRTTVWKCYIHDTFSLWDMSKPDIEAFIEQANLHHPTIEFTAETFDTETALLDTVVYKDTRFKEKSILDAKTYFKQTETFLQTHFTSCHPPNVKKGFVKGEALRMLRKNSSETTFEENNSNLKKKNA